MRVHREHHAFPQLGLVAGTDLRPLDHRHADRVPGDVAEPEAALVEALGDRRMDVVRRRAVVEGGARDRVVLLVGVHHLARDAARLARADRPRHLDPVRARAGDLERRQDHVGRGSGACPRP